MPVKYYAELVLRVNMTKLISVGRDDKEGASPFDPKTMIALAKSNFFVRAALDEKGVMDLPSIREQLDPVQWLRKELQVGFAQGSPELLAFSMRGSNPRELEILVDAIA